jgi:phosphatidate phosphatase LPIN
MFGNDWSHAGIARLYQALIKNGYKILYLTSRPIGQVLKTRSYLTRLTQDGLGMPLGPVITSPDRMFKSFMREVVHKKSMVFKAKALKEIVELFPPSAEPFYAGFGNRDNDAVAYRAAGIPMSRIYIINPIGQVIVLDKKPYLTDYQELTTLADELFPTTAGF